MIKVMTALKPLDSIVHKEHVAELLKERIYATLALLAVLISIDSHRETPMKAAFLVTGTIVSLWAASIVASRMSRRMIFQDELDIRADSELQVRKHAPMLVSLVFPLLMIGLATVRIMALELAINISIVSGLLLLAGWSVLSARSMHAKKIPTSILIAVELAIGLAVVGLKVYIGH